MVFDSRSRSCARAQFRDINGWAKSMQKNIKPKAAEQGDFFQNPKKPPALSMLINLIKDEEKYDIKAVLRDRAK